MKLSSLLIVGALLVSSAVPVLATGRHHSSRGSSGVEVDNEANIANVSLALSNSGMNRQNSRGRMTTGYAVSDSYALVDTVNKTTLPRRSSRGLEIDNEANILNVSAALSNSGMNEQTGGRSRHHSMGGLTLLTGDTESMSAAEVMNVNVTGF